jgi:hypothetical protein
MAKSLNEWSWMLCRPFRKKMVRLVSRRSIRKQKTNGAEQRKSFRGESNRNKGLGQNHNLKNNIIARQRLES